jgi:carbon-monoxide dehydrogenase medium subunit
VLPAFDYVRVSTVAEALEAVAAAGPAMFLAGGQGLLSELGRGARRPVRLVDIGGIDELAAIAPAGDAVVTGARVRLCDVAARDLPRGLELLARAAAHVGYEPIRSQATLGGNLLYGLPTSEVTLAVMAAGAEVVLRRLDGSEAVLRGDELADLRPAADESPFLVTAIRWPVPAGEVGTDVVEVGEQGGWLPALAIVTQVTGGRARVAFGVRGGGKRCLELGLTEEITLDDAGPLPPAWVARQLAASIERAAA